MPFNIIKKNPTAGEVTSSLTNASDAAGLHFDGAAGNIDIASPPDLGTKFSFEFVVQADVWDTTQRLLVDFGASGRFIVGQENGNADLAVYDGSAWRSFGTPVLDDLKVHHLVVTVDGTAVIAYDNGSQVGTATVNLPTIDLAADAKIAANYVGGDPFNGTLYRTRFWNKTLSQAEVTASYENATVPTADRWGSPTSIVAGWDFTSGWSIASGTVDDLNSFTSSGISGVVKNYGLTIGDVYTVTIAGSTTAAGFNFTNSSGAGTGLIGGFGTHVFTAVNASIYLRNGGTGTTDITTLELHKAGVVADYDLAFAQPEISTMVQDRAGAADGTSSASGVTQVTKIEQLNSKSARIGTSAATPADGELIVDGAVKIYGSSPELKIFDTGGSTTFGIRNNTNQLDIRNANSGVVFATIDSAGDSTFSGDVTASGNVGVGTTTTPTSPAGAARFVEISGSSASIVLTDSDAATWEWLSAGGNLKAAKAGSDIAIFSSTGLAVTGNATFSSDISTDTFSATGVTAGFTSNQDATDCEWKYSSSTTGTGVVFRFYNPNGNVGVIYTNGSATVYATSSDYRLKENVTEITGALDRIDLIPAYRFNFKADPTKTVDGFFAHEVAEQVPESIIGTKDEMQTVVTTEAVEAIEAVAATYYEEGDELPDGVAIGDEKTPAVEAVEAVAEVTEEQPKYQGIDQSKLVPLMLAAIKELKAKVTALENA